MAEKVAREIVEQHGGDAVKIVRERAEAARLLGDELAAETWRDIATADTAERLVAERGLNSNSRQGKRTNGWTI